MNILYNYFWSLNSLQCQMVEDYLMSILLNEATNEQSCDPSWQWTSWTSSVEGQKGTCDQRPKSTRN